MIFGKAVIPGNVTLSLENGIDAGDPFALVFFDGLNAESVTINGNSSYAVATDPSWRLPSDGEFTQYLANPPENGLQQLDGVATTLDLALGSAANITYDSWALAKFGDPSLPQAQATADFDGDTYPNLFEYAFDMNPLVASDERAPEVTLEVDHSGEYLLMDYTRPLDRVGITLHVEVSTDLKQWVRGPSAAQEIFTEVSDTQQRHQIRSLADSHTTSLFMRMTVEADQ